MIKYIAKYVVASSINIAVVISLVFLLMNILPSDPARVRLGIRYNEKDALVIRQQYGLDKPLVQQFGQYLWNLSRGDFGISILTGERISAALSKRWLNSFILILFSIIFSFPSILIAIRGALKDAKIYRLGESILFSMSVVPVFVIAVIIVFFAGRWLQISLIPDKQGLQALPYYIMPALLLSIYPSFVLYKIVRDTLKDTLTKPFILTLQAFGFPGRRVIFPYALRACAVSLLGILTNLTAYYLTSIYLIEFIFSIGGIGSWAVSSAQNYDIPVILATVIISAIIYNIVNIITRIAAPMFDRRLVYA
jgi:ABC-type dipeptide/oligopeptide/nickel transport system permease component